MDHHIRVWRGPQQLAVPAGQARPVEVLAHVVRAPSCCFLGAAFTYAEEEAIEL